MYIHIHVQGVCTYIHTNHEKATAPGGVNVKWGGARSGQSLNGFYPFFLFTEIIPIFLPTANEGG